jgi:ADP-ribosyl-[dinitrogen reductase] hydrolase
MIWNTDRFAGSLAGVRLGDALGLPFEILTPDRIREITGDEGVTKFWSPQQRDDAPLWAQKLRVLKPGDFSDDWQMTRAGARSLLRSKQLDLEDLAREYLAEMNTCDLGWGGTTKWGLRQIEKWFNSGGTLGRNPRDFPLVPERKREGFGTGNGVVMRIAPFGLMNTHVFDRNGKSIKGQLLPFRQMIWNVGGLTHPDPRATIGAYVVASLIAKLAGRNGDPLGENEVAKRYTYTLRELKGFALFFAFEEWKEQIDAFEDCLLDVPRTRTAEEARVRFGTSSYTFESVPFSIATFLRHPTDFKAALKEAVEAGGDTDTNAAIVGSLVGANVGANNIPDDWRIYTRGVGGAEDLGIQLWALLHKQGLLT